MKYSLFIIFGLVLLAPFALPQTIQGEPFVVVELFSSEGCSSCPPADALVSQLTAWARQNKQPVYPLIFHVDYWNDLGWHDAYSSQEFTQRQYTYARLLPGGVYTPEMIVNGSDAFNGSDGVRLQEDMRKALSMPVAVILHISFTKQEKKVILKYSVDGFSRGDVINIALVERGLTSQVTAGENAGHTLNHNNVVREFQTKVLTPEASEVEISLDKVSDAAKTSVIAYVQDSRSMLIKAARQLDLGDG